MNLAIQCQLCKLLGHTLRMNVNTPAQKAMQYYFENNKQSKQFRGRPRTTIATVLNRDIKEAAKPAMPEYSRQF